MSEENKCSCEFCQLNKLREKALASNDIKFVKDAMEKFADLWLNIDFDLSFHMCILDGSWDTAEEILTRSLAKVRKHNNRCVLCGGEYDKKSESQICYVCKKIVAKAEKAG